ncbi:MAG TPA: exodeoxyribonuclease VII large subunit [Epulopiscium sp.]|nr:exodeoxyribonuclease VII large subunit [Candidatus Epulonipiscium sp.]
MKKKVFSVSDINSYVKNMLEDDYVLRNVYIKGEISNFKHHSSGHMYFTLKDPNGAVSGVMFRASASSLTFEPKEGMMVIARASVSLYVKTGQYQIYVYEMEVSGRGTLHEAFEQLKNKLDKEGLFDQEYKKPIPYFPKTIGVITSGTGAAVRDILNITRRRNPGVKIYVYPVLVQGEGSAFDISNAIEAMNEHGLCEVLIVGRGGGSIEDLCSFNEEIVARAIFNSKIPVISAVGHETDFTIADFVSSLRAPTPSAAAELATPHVEELQRRVDQHTVRMEKDIYQYLEHKARILNMYTSRPVLAQAGEYFARKGQDLDLLHSRLQDILETTLSRKQSFLGEKVAKLDALSPLNTLQRGYALVTDENDNVVTSIGSVQKEQTLSIRLKDGKLQARVE